jgi:iron complex transport system ATP-binding protein
MIEVKNLSAGYNSTDVIRSISFIAARGESLCVLGPNGCGKSTLLKSLVRIINYRGAVLLDNCNIAGLQRKALAKKIAFLEQITNVFFPYTVYDTVAMGRYAHSEGLFKNLSAWDKAIINDIMKKLDILDIKDCMTNELSGGQLQRVFLAKTLAQMPEVILLDEPTNHLDLKYQIELLTFLKTWVKENNKIMIGVYHDLNMARHFNDTALLICGVLNNETETAYGTIDEIIGSETIEKVYGIDVRAFMIESLKRWERIT